MTRAQHHYALSRRGLLGVLAVGGAAALAGCQVDTGASTSGSSGQGNTSIKFPDYSTKLPTDDVTFRWTDSGDLKSVFEKAVLTAFTDKHNNIKTNYQGSGWDTVNQVVPLGIRNKSAPDVFALPQGTPAATAVNEKWVHPLDDLIPDFDKWKAGFPDTAFVPGLHVFGGKTYSFPLSSDRRLGSMMFYDTANFKSSGYDDPVNEIKTWDDLHAALTKVVKAGHVGLMMGVNYMSDLVSFLANTAGWSAVGGMDYKTGKYVYDAPEVMQAFEFMQKLAQDKLIVPGFLNLDQADARAQMTAGKAGLCINGPWDIPAWKKAAPDWKYAVGKTPSPDGADYLIPFEQNGANNPWAYAETKIPTVVGQILAYMGSQEGQKMMVILSEGNLVSLQDSANQAADQPGLLDPNAKKCSDLADELMRSTPLVAFRNADVAQVNLVQKQVQPTWTDLMVGLFTGQLKDAKKQFAMFNSAQEKSLDDAIKEANKRGAKISRDDWVFPNWDPTKDYTKADYQALG